MEAEKKSHQKSDTKVSIQRQNNKVVKTDQMSLESPTAGDLLLSSPPGVTHNDCELLREVPYSVGLRHYMAAVQKWVRKIQCRMEAGTQTAWQCAPPQTWNILS